MRKYILLLVVLEFLLCPLTSKSQLNSELDLFYKLSDYYFNKYVYNGLVDYQYASKYSKEIDALYNLIGRIETSKMSLDKKKSFYINAYNVLVIYQVAKSYPINNPLDQEGFFDGNRHLVAGERVTLDDLESRRMFDQFQDERLHFVLACAAKGCPPLANFAYRPENLDQLVEERTRQVLNSNSFVKVDNRNKVIRVSKIFDWYREDFEKGGESIITYINKYRREKIPTDYRVEFYEYDWSLNERKS